MPSRLVVPTVMLVHTGRTSGRTIRTPIGAIELCDGWVIGDGNYGRARRPDWSRNLRANPMAVVETRAGV